MSHSDNTQPRRLRGQPTGGQFAEKNRPASGLELIRADEPQTAAHGGLVAQVFDSEVDGSLVVQLDTDQARGRKVRVYINDGTIYDGDPEADETLEQQAERLASAPLSVRMSAAMERFHQAREEMERLSAGIVTEMVREQYPEARYMTLEHSDQGDYWEGAEILGDDRETLGEWDDVAYYGDRENEAIYLSNLDSHATYPFIVPAAEGRTMYFDLDEAAKYAAS